MTAEAHQSVTGLPRYILPLGFTSPPLTLNGRPHYRTRARLVRAVRTAVVVRARQLDMRPARHVHVSLHYVPRDRRTRDADNLVATLKPAIDALTAQGADRGRICASIVRDDTPDMVSWSTPVIHAPDEHGPRMWLEVQYLTGPPPSEYGDPTEPPDSEG